MRIRWSPKAASDFTGLIKHIRTDNAPAALRVARTMLRATDLLKSFPDLGRPGRVEGTRELVFSPLPFVMVYRVKEIKSKLPGFCMARRSGQLQRSERSHHD